MSESYRLSGDDSILPFGLERAGIRGRVARLDATLGRILDQHRYPVLVSALVAEAATLTALIGQAIKLRWKLSLQIRGEGPVRLIATDYFAPEEPGAPAQMRAYAAFDMGEVVSSRAPPFSLLGEGLFGVVIDQGEDMRPYQGLTPLAGGSLAACAETYFAQSEQLATRFHIEAARAEMPGRSAQWRAAGLMLQQLPDDLGHAPEGPSAAHGLMTADDVAAMGSGEEDWNRVNHLMRTVETHELIGPHVAMEELLLRLFHEERPTAYPWQAVIFGCTCSPERVSRALAECSAAEIEEMTTDDGRVTADCQFCSAHYEFDPEMLGAEATLNLDGSRRG